MNSYFVKALNLSFAGLLLLSAYLQLNDPDPIIWISFYIICALVPLSAVFNFYHRLIFRIAVVLCVLHMGIGLPGALEYLKHMTQQSLVQDMSPERPYIEETREFLGSLIALVMICITALLARKKNY